MDVLERFIPSYAIDAHHADCYVDHADRYARQEAGDSTCLLRIAHLISCAPPGR